MRRRLAIAGLVATALATAPSIAFGEQPPAFVKTVKCSVAEHEAVFYARMHRLAGTQRMAMRFTLLERAGEEGFVPVRVPGLGGWHRSKPGVAVLGYRQGVRNLRENAVYRVRVDFRWYSRERGVQHELRRRSPCCRQYEARPDLAPG
jgi:hypothetical protein